MSQRNPNELGTAELEAFRFLAGEMTADEESRFERRLAEEPQLALVLSEVIELEQAVSEATPEPSVVVRRADPARRVAAKGSRQSVFPVLAAIAACVVVAVVVAPRALQTRSNSVTAVEPIDAEVAVEFVDQWLESAVDVSYFASFTEPEDEPVELAMLDPVDAAELGSTDVVPDWMYVAFEEAETTGVTVE